MLGMSDIWLKFIWLNDSDIVYIIVIFVIFVFVQKYSVWWQSGGLSFQAHCITRPAWVQARLATFQDSGASRSLENRKTM